MLVWKAMPSITPMMSEILRELALITSMVRTTWETTSPLRVATCAAEAVIWLACRAASAPWWTVWVRSSRAEAVSCR